MMKLMSFLSAHAQYMQFIAAMACIAGSDVKACVWPVDSLYFLVAGSGYIGLYQGA